MKEFLVILCEVIYEILMTFGALVVGVLLLSLVINLISMIVARKKHSKRCQERRKKAMKEKQKQSEGDMYRRLWAAEDKPCEIVYKKGVNVYLNGYIATPQMAEVWRR